MMVVKVAEYEVAEDVEGDELVEDFGGVDCFELFVEFE
jgi:hypothetical protein